MAELRDNFGYWGNNSDYWRQHGERARKCAEQARQRAECARDYLSKQMILKVAKRYDQMANLAEERVKKRDEKYP
jgi:hypothetical protein